MVDEKGPRRVSFERASMGRSRGAPRSAVYLEVGKMATVERER